VLDALEKGEKGGAAAVERISLGIRKLPEVARDNTDRNRTSPFAFTGNKFEFRAVGSNQSIAFPNICLNLAVAESLDAVATELETAVKGGEKLEDAVSRLLTRLVKEHKRIIFNGNNYAEEWQKEAGRRGLLNLRNTVDSLPQLIAPDVVKMFETYKVLNERELHARYDVNLETYTKTINIEAQLMVLMANRYILPAALKYQKEIAESVAAVKAAGGASREGKKLLARFTKLIDRFRTQTDALAGLLEHAGSSAEKHAKHMRDKVIPTMTALREHGDEIEVLVPHELWPLPTYREMLFVK